MISKSILIIYSLSQFERRHLEAEAAEENLVRSEPDSRVSRAEIEKIRDYADDSKAR